MKNFDNYNEYFEDEYYEDEYYNTSFQKSKKGKASKSQGEDLFPIKSCKKKKKDYKKLQREKEKMKIDAVNSLFGEEEEE